MIYGGTGATTASAARTNLGLGTIATQSAAAVAITGGTINGAVIGGSSPAAGSFTNLTVINQIRQAIAFPAFPLPGSTPTNIWEVNIGGVLSSVEIPAAVMQGIVSKVKVPTDYAQRPWPNTAFTGIILEGDSDPDASVVALFGFAGKYVAGGGPFGLNVIAANCAAIGCANGSGFNGGVEGAEININMKKVATATPTGNVFGLKIIGGSEVNPTNGSFAIYLDSLGAGIPFDYGIFTADGGTTNAVNIGQLAVGSNSASQFLTFKSTDGSAVEHFTQIQQTAAGLLHVAGASFGVDGVLLANTLSPISGHSLIANDAGFGQILGMIGAGVPTPNSLQVENAASGSAPIIRAVGTDTNINIQLIAKGSGIVTGSIGAPSGPAGGALCGSYPNPTVCNLTLAGAFATGGALTFADLSAANTLLYTTSARNVAGLATANNGVLVTNGSGVPSVSSVLPNGLSITGAPALAFNWLDTISAKIALNMDVTAASNTLPEFGIEYIMRSATGFANASAAYKVAFASWAKCTAGTANCYAGNLISTMGAGAGNVLETTLELNTNNNNQAYTSASFGNAAASYGLVLANGGSFKSTAAIWITDPTATAKLWSVGIGFTADSITEYTLFDATNSTVHDRVEGTHTTVWDASTTTATNVLVGPGSSSIITGAGALTAINATFTAAAPTVAAAQVGFGSTTAAAANCNVAVPTPTGCLVTNVAGTPRYVPYY